ncbi:ParB/RepB/Spo0J family partition protein [Kitasatospora sp. NPDC088548]|uniref:ParB/RepB/Spo0J family partition protein n=1 Tax=Kitasatospora sp. NPDC088548 TaxID=3364075 RepID=UPI0037F1E70C
MTATATSAAPTGLRTRSMELMQVDPRTLVLDPHNVRDEDVELDQAMLDSVMLGGVDTPVIIRPLTKEQAEALAEPGKPLPEYGVLMGQRRWLTALEAVKLAKENHEEAFALPVILREDLKGATAEALTKSLVENLHRKDMTAANIARKVTQLAAVRMNPTQRAKATKALGLTPAQFKAAKKATAMDPNAFRKASENDFDFVQMADYDTVKDVPSALNDLVRAMDRDLKAGGGDGHWQHAMAQLRQTRDKQVARQKAIAALKAAGAPQVEFEYDWTGKPQRPLRDLVTGLGKAIKPERHVEECPGRAYFIEYGEPVHLCADWKKYHELSPEARARMGKAATSEEEREKLRAVKAGNAAFKAATEVRRAAQKAAIKGAKVPDAEWTLIMSVTTEMPDWYGTYVKNPNRAFMADLLGLMPSGTDLTPTGYQEKANLQEDAAARLKEYAGRIGKERRGKVLLAQIFAALEVNVMRTNKVWAGVHEALAKALIVMRDHLGYTPADIETDMIDRYLASVNPTKDDGQAAPQAPETADARTEDEDAADSEHDTGEAPEDSADREPEAQQTEAPAAEVEGEPEAGAVEQGRTEEPVEQEQKLDAVLAA